jgi:hypothetical protein
MEDVTMASIIEKTIKEIEQIEEKASVLPNTKYSTLNTNKKEVDNVKVQVDTSDEQNVDESDIFSMFNQSSAASDLKVDVQVVGDEGDEGDSNIAEGGEETVMGQGSNPKPEDETYLNLLKKTTPKPKVKIKVDK